MKTIGPALVGWVLFFTTPVRADSYNYTFYPGANLVAHHLDRGSNTVHDIFPDDYRLSDQMRGLLDSYLGMQRTSPAQSMPVLVFNYGQTLPTPYGLPPPSYPTFLDYLDVFSETWNCETCVWCVGDGLFIRTAQTHVFNYTFEGNPRTPSGRIAKIPAGGALLLGAETLTNGTYEIVIGAAPTEGVQVYRFNATTNYPDAFHFGPPEYNVYTFNNGEWSPLPPVLNIGEAAWFRAPPPTLGIRATNNTVVLSWPTNAIPFTLESATQFGSPTSWSAVGIPIVTNSDLQTVTVPSTTAETRLFRLRH